MTSVSAASSPRALLQRCRLCLSLLLPPLRLCLSLSLQMQMHMHMHMHMHLRLYLYLYLSLHPPPLQAAAKMGYATCH